MKPIPTMDYRLRVTPWARGISLRVTLAVGLEVVAPRRYSTRTIGRILAREAAWIRSAQVDAAARRQALPSPPTWRMPPEIVLPAVGARWVVSTEPTVAHSVRVVPAGTDTLVFAGAVEDAAACRHVLRRWLLEQGRAHLLPRLTAVSHGCGLPYARSTVRLARTRWGSCSRRGAISLNARLLLLSPTLVDYVLVHELCHTREPNHSPAFWSLVARHRPAYLIHRRDLRAAGRRLPAWALDPGERTES